MQLLKSACVFVAVSCDFEWCTDAMPLCTGVSLNLYVAGVGGMRVSLNTAMLIFSPLAGALTERIPVRSILVFTTFARMVNFVLLMPGMC